MSCESERKTIVQYLKLHETTDPSQKIDSVSMTTRNIKSCILPLSLAAYNPGRFWLDATDLLAEGDWIWSTLNEPILDTFSHWAPNEPNNVNSVEHCLAVDFTNNLQWNDEDCERKNNFICEIE